MSSCFSCFAAKDSKPYSEKTNGRKDSPDARASVITALADSEARLEGKVACLTDLLAKEKQARELELRRTQEAQAELPATALEERSREAKLEEQVASLQARLAKEQHVHAADMERSRQTDQELRVALDQLEESRYHTSLEIQQASQETMKLRDDLQKSQEAATRQVRESQDARLALNGGSSEGRLRLVMTSPNASTDELRSAISAVEALVEEARRELARKELREKRAAFEQLGNAIDKADEKLLEIALNTAVKAGLSPQDIKKGREKLEELQSKTDEEKEARIARELETAKKKEAFLYIKRDDPALLGELLDGLGDDARWMEWRDYAGRTLLKCSQALRAERVQAMLAARLVSPSEQRKSVRSCPSRQISRDSSLSIDAENLFGSGDPSSASQAPAAGADDPNAADSRATHTRPSASSLRGADSQTTPLLSARRHSKPLDSVGDWWADNPEVHSTGSGSPHPPDPSVNSAGSLSMIPQISERASQVSSPEGGSPITADEQTKLKAKAMRAVVQNDAAVLESVLEDVPLEIWCLWQNKAGKTLLELADERGSSEATASILKAQGVLEEQKRDTFEEREDVWVYNVGDVQPSRAVVLEDVDEHAKQILIEYWNGNDPPCYVDRAVVRKDYNVNGS